MPTQDELNYPVAYSIVVHANFGQVERLIRAIWRPQERSSTRLVTVTFRIRYAAYRMRNVTVANLVEDHSWGRHIARISRSTWPKLACTTIEYATG